MNDYTQEEQRHMFISEDAEAVDTVRTMSLLGDTDERALGTALGYPDDAVEAFTSSDSAAGLDVMRFIITEMEMSPEEARYFE